MPLRSIREERTRTSSRAVRTRRHRARRFLAVLLGVAHVLGLSSVFDSACRVHADPPDSRVVLEDGNPAKISPAGRRSIDRGMEWLISAIQRRGVGTDLNQPPDLGCTAIVGLALLAEGNTLSTGPHADQLESILDSVLVQVEYRRNGGNGLQTLVQRKIGHNADVFLSALFLSQVLGESGYSDKEVRAALQGLVDTISRSQGEDGTWGDESWAPVLGTVLGWESLRASSACGMRVEASAERAGKALLKKLETHTANEQDWMHNFYKEASGVRVLHSLRLRNEPAFQECVQRMVAIARDDDRPFVHAGGEEYLSFYLVTECLLQQPKNEWKTWYPNVSEKLIRHQNRDGSWSGHHCITARTFCTAAVLLTLMAPNQYLTVSDL